MADEADLLRCWAAGAKLARATVAVRSALDEVERFSGARGGLTAVDRANILLSEVSRGLSETTIGCGVDGELTRLQTQLEGGVTRRRVGTIRILLDSIDKEVGRDISTHSRPAEYFHGQDYPSLDGYPNLYREAGEVKVRGESPSFVVLTMDGYALLHGKKADVTTFVRTSDGEIEYNLYPPGKGPKTQEEAEDAEPLIWDGGVFEFDPKRPEGLRGFERFLRDEAGLEVRLAVPNPLPPTINEMLGLGDKRD